jgi:hypothetical protein
MPISSMVWVLIHSPLVGPYTWSPVAARLNEAGFLTAVPQLTRKRSRDGFYWKQHAQDVAHSVRDFPPEIPMILVAHSGAGPLLPAVRAEMDRPVQAYIFVDALLPSDGKSRLDQFEDPQAAHEFAQAADRGYLPAWSFDDLAEIIPDPETRSSFVRELSPTPLEVYQEPIPVPIPWPDADCAYLRFGANPAYTAASEKARQAGYAYQQIDGNHFHMLVDPGGVARRLSEMVSSMR